MASNRRPFTQIAASASFVLLWLLTASPLKSWFPTNAWLRLDPLLALTNWASTRTLTAVFWPAGVFLLAAVWWGRAFCTWLCPVGACLDCETWACKRLRYSGYRTGLKFPRLNLVLLAVTLEAAVLGAGAAVGLVDPLVFAHRGLTFLRAGRIPEMLILVLALGLIAPRFWCRYLCPLGGLLGVLHAPLARLKLKRRPGLAGAPSTPPAEAAGGPGGRLSRRAFLGLLAGAAVTGAGPARAAKAFGAWPRPFLRPPGALSEGRFTASCVRCGECVKVCPTRGLQPALTEAGLAGLWTPHLVPRTGECVRCMLCGKVCPTGALRPIPVAVMKIGTARIDPATCWAWNGTRPCRVCFERCPKKIIRLDDLGRPVVDPQACDGCGVCERYCPVSRAAIVVWPDGERRRDQERKDAADATVREEL